MVRLTLFTLALIASAPLAAQTAGETPLPRAKVIADAEAEFARADTNKDGKMTRVEIEAAQRTSQMTRATARNKAMFTELDSDKNGQISAVEFAKAIPAPRVDATSVLSVDTNKDGQVSLAEHRTATADTFGKMDANKDGSLTAAEVRTAMGSR